MFLNIIASKAALTAKAVIILLLSALVMTYSSDCASCVREGINLCLGVLVPSVFPFMAIASFIVNSGIAESAGKPFAKITKALFGLSPCFAPIILLSMIGGYPVGARSISTVYKNRLASKFECKKAAMTAVCAGPGFLINYIGVSIYGNRNIGIILLAAQIMSVFIIGIFLNLIYKSSSNEASGNFSDKEIRKNPIPTGTAIVQSVLDSTKGMLSICAFVVLFSAMTGILSTLIPESSTKDGIFVILEVCTAVNKLSANHTIELIAFASGFGGVCVHFQIYSVLDNLGISKLLFFCIRIMQGVITAVITHFGLMLINDSRQVFSTSTVTKADIFGGSIISGITLLGIAICFLYTIKNYKQN